MPKQSSIKRLPPEIREQIGALLQQGRSLDEIVKALKALDVTVSRSGLHRWKQRTIDKAAEKVERSRAVAEALVQRFGDAPEGKATRLNVELMHGMIMDIMLQADKADKAEAENDEAQARDCQIDDDKAAGTPMGAMLLAKALDHLARASKSDVETIARIKKEVAKEAEAKMEAALDTAAKEAEMLSPMEMLEKVRAVYRGEA